MAKLKTASAPVPHHYLRTIVAALLGALALLLVSASVLLVWADRTLTDNATYVQTVGPLLGRPELQNFVATKVTDQLLQQMPIDQAAAKLLTPEQRAGKTEQQLQTLVTQTIHDRVTRVLQSPSVQTAWKSTNQSAQADLIKQLDAGTEPVNLDFTPLVSAATTQLQQTNLIPAKAGALPAGAGKVAISGKGLKQVSRGYNALKTAAPIVVALTLLLVALSVWASVHHAKTLRRILITTGVSSLLVAVVIALPTYVSIPGPDPATAKLAGALVGTLLHGLQMGCLVLGVACIALAIGSKVYDRKNAKISK